MGAHPVTAQDAEERLALRELMGRYARALDRGDYALLRRLFTEDAYFEFNGGQVVNRNVDEIVRMIQSLQGTRITVHFLTNQYIELHGEMAYMETYGQAHHLRPREGEGERDAVCGVCYRDQLIKVNGEWRIRHRLETVEWRREDVAISPVLGKAAP